MNCRILSLLSSIALAACATADPRSTNPEFVIDSGRPAKDVALCIADAWDKLRAPSTVRETKTGYSVYWVNTAVGHIALLADIDNLDAKRVRITFRRNLALGVASHEAAVRECKDE